MRSGRTQRLTFVVALALALGSSCEDGSNLVNVDTSALAVVFVDPGLAPQRIEDGESAIQIAEWKISEAKASQQQLELDLTAGQGCVFGDVYTSFPITEQKCGGGIVVGGSEERSVELSVTFTMQAVRGHTVHLTENGDFDQDGLGDLEDACPLVFSEPGDASPCRNDWDADGILNVSSTMPQDNCLWVPNADEQPDNPLIPRPLIGDACREAAPVLVEGSQVIRLELGPIEYFQPIDRRVSLLVDLNDEFAIDCDWPAGFCELDPDQVEFCALIQQAGEVPLQFASRASRGCPRSSITSP